MSIRTIKDVKRLVNTPAGGPRYRLDFTDGSRAQTKPNATLGWELSPMHVIGKTLDVLFENGYVTRLVAADTDAELLAVAYAVDVVTEEPF